MREGYEHGNNRFAGSFESPQGAAGQASTDSPAWATAGGSQQHTEVRLPAPGRRSPGVYSAKTMGYVAEGIGETG